MRERVAELTGARRVETGERIQSLWSGYGEVRRVTLDDEPAIVKHVRPPADAHPRKLRSYQVELAWYRDWAPACPVRVPRFLGAWSDGRESLFVLEDLDAAGYAERARWVGDPEHRLVLTWLARFHATWLGRAPEGLWPIGTYWHLGTRPDELRRMTNGALRREAPELDRALREARFQTLVHGDAKPANFCFREDRLGVAAVDFQYVGGGPGIRDVAYWLGAWRKVDRVDERLALYFSELRGALPESVDADALEDEWRGLYPVATRDFERFLDGWR